jgi:hypothetical protein
MKPFTVQDHGAAAERKYTGIIKKKLHHYDGVPTAEIVETGMFQ